MTGTRLDIEPEDLEPVDFTFFDVRYEDIGNDPEDGATWRWNADVIRSWATTTGIMVDDILAYGQPSDGPDAVWAHVIDRLIETGFDVYESDTRIEIYQHEDES